MSVVHGVNERLAALTEAGVSIWLDQIRRSLIDSGELERMVREDSLRGVTANPSIFEKAILGSPDYDVHSVASFFVSRVDTEVDKRLEASGRTELQGTAAVANARAAYIRFKEMFHGERFASLLGAGAHVQRPLWASTGTKNPRYSDVKYIEELVAPETVNTMPLPTLLAFGEHGEVRGATADAEAAEVERDLK